MVASGRFFYQLGYDIFRLNLRDHGNSHHLNRGPFLGTLIDEAYGAVKRIIADYGSGGSTYIIGFSMGANFALRIAKRAGDETAGGAGSGLPDKVIAVNPPLNPLTATQNIDKYFLIRKYFLKKWKKSLIKKQQHFLIYTISAAILIQITALTLQDILLINTRNMTAWKSISDIIRSALISLNQLNAGISHYRLR